MKSGIEYMVWLADWYTNSSGSDGIGFFQIGGGIAGDFPILRSADVAPGFGTRWRAVLELLLPDFGLNHEAMVPIPALCLMRKSHGAS